jgi:hypothetical protein
MRNELTTVAIACIGLLGIASPASAQMLSATRAVIAIVADDLYVGQAVGHLNGAGTLAIHAQRNPAVTCTGEFTSSAALGGSGQLQCSDGSVATFQFKRLTAFTGHGVGSFGGGALSFVYGLSATDAAPYLTLPEGKKLMGNGSELALADL